MYGLVNKAIEDLAVSLVGRKGWQEITALAGVDTVSFVSLDHYDDDITYRLVGAAATVLGLPAEKVLEAFGEHWILYTGREGYGTLMTAYGSDVGSFLRNLDTMHARVELMMPQLRPPQIDVDDEEPSDEGPDAGRSFLVRYRSTREGLAPMVVGLLRGVGAMFGREVTVTWLPRPEGADHEAFRVVEVGPLATVPQQRGSSTAPATA